MPSKQQRRKHQPGQGDRLMAGAPGDAFRQPHQERADRDADQRAGRDKAERLGANARRNHVGRRDPQLLRGVEAHTEHQHSNHQAHDAVQQHRQTDDDCAGERQRQAELDAGLAAIAVGDLADRVGHQESADAEQRDGQACEARRAGERDHHQRADAIGKLHGRTDERLRQRKQRHVALDQAWNVCGKRAAGGLVHRGPVRQG